MKKITLYLGLNDKDTKKQELTTVDAFKIVNNIIKDCTIVEGLGKYTHKDGTIVNETTFIITIFDFDNTTDIKAICSQLKTVLNQESVAVSIENIESQLY